MLMLLPLLPHRAIIMGAFVFTNSDKHAFPACSRITCRRGIRYVRHLTRGLRLVRFARRQGRGYFFLDNESLQCLSSCTPRLCLEFSQFEIFNELIACSVPIFKELLLCSNQPLTWRDVTNTNTEPDGMKCEDPASPQSVTYNYGSCNYGS
eukprot:sb/3473511/